MSDLKSLIPNDMHTFEVRHPVSAEVLTKDNGKPMTITIYSPYSDKFKQVAHAQAKKRLSKAKGVDAQKELTIDDYTEFALDTLAATTHAWDLQFDKKSLPFSEERAKQLYKELPWLIDQVKDVQDRISNFFTK